MNVNDFLSFARQLMDEHGLSHVGLELDRAKTRFGACHWKKVNGEIVTDKITFSKLYVETGPQENILNTVLHEIAHALAGPMAKHGPLWVAKCREIGYDKPTRCGTAPHPAREQRKEFNLICPSCQVTVLTKKGHRKPTKQYIHKCGARTIWQ